MAEQDPKDPAGDEFEFELDFPEDEDTATGGEAEVADERRKRRTTQSGLSDRPPPLVEEFESPTVIPPDAFMEQMRTATHRSMIPGPGVSGSGETRPTDPGMANEGTAPSASALMRNSLPDIAPETPALSEEDYIKRLGSLDTHPRVKVSLQEAMNLGLNHRAGFLFSQIDGTMTFDDLLSISPMSREDSLRIFVELLEAGAIEA